MYPSPLTWLEIPTVRVHTWGETFKESLVAEVAFRVGERKGVIILVSLHESARKLES